MNEPPRPAPPSVRGKTMQRLSKRPIVALVVVAVMLLAARVWRDQAGTSATSDAVPSLPPPSFPPTEHDDHIEAVEDPITLVAMGEHALAAGDRDKARKLFAASVKKDEINLYTPYDGASWGKAMIHERMGELDEAEKIYREEMIGDAQYTAYFLAHKSIHPQRTQLLEDVRQHVLSLAEKAKAGETPLHYVTKSGAKRFLEKVDAEDALATWEKGGRLTYAYIDEIDLSGKTFPGRVGCYRCIVRVLHGWNSTFADQFDFNGIVLEELHLGKRWAGKVNDSSVEPGSKFNRLYLDHAVFFGKVNLEGVEVTGRVANCPFATFLGETNFRNAVFEGTAEFRYAHFATEASFKATHFKDSAYFAYAHFGGLDLSRVHSFKRPVHFASAHFAGDLLVEDAIFGHGATFENARFEGSVLIRRAHIDETLNLSLIHTTGDFHFSRNEAKDIAFYGARIEGDARFDDCVVHGRSSFAPDELTYRMHLEDSGPLHQRYKLYQGDDDAEEDLTRGNQYGVLRVDDLVSRFEGNVSFANSYFKQFAGFERVTFGQPEAETYINFYNTQFGGEAHFERALFYGTADFRTIGGLELSFNHARFFGHWLLDDANVPGRLSTTETDLIGDATISISGADIRSFGIDFRQLLYDVESIWGASGHRLFYEQCTEDLAAHKDPAPYLADPRLRDAKWNDLGTERLTDDAEIIKRAEQLCIGRTVDEFTRLKDSFDGRSMSDESDWAYWHLKHYLNHRKHVNASAIGKVEASFEKLLFEKGFGWGVLLENLLATSLVVVLFFAVLIRVFCGDMEVEWDEFPCRYRDLPMIALVIISMHSFLGGFGNSEALVTNSSSTYKILFTAEIMVGIIVITFFIGAYTRLVLS